MRIAVVGGGVAGLSALATLRARIPEADAFLLERSDRVGGLIATEQTVEGFVVEHGPDSLVTHDGVVEETLTRLDLIDEVVVGTDVQRRAFVARGSKLHPLPANLMAMSPSVAVGLTRSRLLSARAKARFLLEPLVPRRETDDDESVESFFRRRFGAELADAIIGPLLAGVYGGDLDELSMLATMPKLAALERAHGSVAWGAAQARRTRTSRLPGAVSLRRGLGALPAAMAAEMAGRIHTGVGLRRVQRRRDDFLLELEDDSRLPVHGLVLATPAAVLTRLVEGASAELQDAASRIDFAPHLSLSLAIPREQIAHAMDGTGFIVPPDAGRSITACTWASQKWPGRVPRGWALLRVYCRFPGLTKREAYEGAVADLRDLIGLEGVAMLLRVHRNETALPRREVGHLQLEDAIDEACAALGPVAVAGSGVGTMGVPQCLVSGATAAHRVADRLCG